MEFCKIEKWRKNNEKILGIYDVACALLCLLGYIRL